MNAWQIPISQRDRGTHTVAHYGPVSHDTSVIVKSACGRTFNPGFAEPAGEQTRLCMGCARKIYDEHPGET